MLVKWCGIANSLTSGLLMSAHFEGSTLFMLYPPDPRTEDATMREALLCAREGITINIFLLQNWNQSQEDVQFAYRMAQATKGRVVCTAGRDLDRSVSWDYIKRRTQIISSDRLPACLIFGQAGSLSYFLPLPSPAPPCR